MPITLTQSLIEWLQVEVANGRYSSVEAAVQEILVEHIAQVSQARSLQARSLPAHLTQETVWANGLIDEVRSRIAQGEPETLAAFATYVRQRRVEPGD